MTVTPHDNGVRDSGVDDGLRRLVDVLLPGIDRFADLLTDRITEGEDAYGDHGHVTHDQLRTSCAENLHSMITQLAGTLLTCACRTTPAVSRPSTGCRCPR